MVEKKWSLVARPSSKICWNSFSASVAAPFALHLPDFTFSSMYSRIDLSLHLSYSDWVILESRIMGSIANLFVHKEHLSVDYDCQIDPFVPIAAAAILQR